MKKKNKIRVNPVSIRNILTIRYDITEKPVKKPATIEDFKRSLNDQDGRITEKLLSDSFRKIGKFNKSFIHVLKYYSREKILNIFSLKQSGIRGLIRSLLILNDTFGSFKL